MGRYSFFILSFCYRGHYVYADSSSSDVLLDSSSIIDVSGSDSTVDSESSTLDSSSSIQQEESTSTSVSEESSEENVQNSLDENYEYYDLSNPFVFGNTNNGEDSAANQSIMPRMFTTFASGGPSTVYSGPNNGWNITGYFTSWRLDGTLNATMIANNIDMIVNQARNSFSYVNSRLNGLENWRSTASTTIANLNSTVSSHRTQITNAFSRISSLETGLNDETAYRKSADNSLQNQISNANNEISNEVYWRTQAVNSLSSQISSVNSRISSISSSLENEAKWRTSADESLANQISSANAKIANILIAITDETEWRKKADTALQDQITKINATDATQNKALSDETEWRKKGDTALQDQITKINATNVIQDTALSDETEWRKKADVALQDQITKINATDVKQDTALSDETIWRKSADVSLQNQITKHNENFNTLTKDIDSLNNWKVIQLAWNSLQEISITNLNTAISDETEWRKKGDTALQDQITKINATNVTQDTALSDETEWRKKADVALQDQITKINATDGKQDENIKYINDALTDEIFWRKSADSSLEDNISSLRSYTVEEITNIKNSMLSDVGIIAAIIGLHDTWKSKDYSASILPDDGDAVKLMKSVANKIGSSISTNISLLRDIFGKDGTYWVEYDKRWNNFPLWLQGLLNNYFDNIYNMENKDSLLYRLVYFFIDEMTKTRDFVIEINDNLLIANDSLLIIVDWLRMIYSKPPDIVNVSIPPFDFDRLQQILNGLNFGNIVNEAGTNIWDFLSQLIKTLGEIISTAITGLTDVVGEILDLLGDLINQIIKLIVPENLDFLDTGFGTVKSKIDIKFGSFLSLGNQVKEVVQPIDQDFKKVVSIDIMGAKFNPDFSTIDWVVVRFRTVMALSIWMSVAIYIYRKITGNGDLINDN